MNQKACSRGIHCLPHCSTPTHHLFLLLSPPASKTEDPIHPPTHEQGMFDQQTTQMVGRVMVVGGASRHLLTNTGNGVHVMVDLAW